MLPLIDGLLAATLLQHNLAFVTRDTGALPLPGWRFLTPGRRVDIGHRDSGLSGRFINDSQSVTSRQSEPCHFERLSGNYAVQLSQDMWVVHAFQKKSTWGAKTQT
jgi:hypothetical protein